MGGGNRWKGDNKDGVKKGKEEFDVQNLGIQVFS